MKVYYLKLNGKGIDVVFGSVFYTELTGFSDLGEVNVFPTEKHAAQYAEAHNIDYDSIGTITVEIT